MIENPKIIRPVTAAQIAARLGVSPQAIRKRLKDFPHAGIVLARGIETKAYAPDSLPPEMQAELRAIAIDRGISDIARLFEESTETPLAPLSLFTSEQLEHADKLRRALIPALERRDNPLVSAADLNDILVRNYELAFGRTVTTDYLRGLMKRAIVRDQGRNQWQRIDLYVTEEPSAAVVQSPHQDLPDFLPGLAALFERYATAREFGIDERNVVWDALFQEYDRATSDGCDHRQARRLLVDLAAAHLPRIGRTPRAIEAAFDARLARWSANGRNLAALADKRQDPRAPNVHQLNEDEVKWLRFYCAKCENVSLGWEDFLESAKATESTKEAFRRERNGKRPQVPKRIRDLVRVSTRVLPFYIRGKRAATLAGAYRPRNPDTLAAGESDQADDKTIEAYWYDETTEGLWFGQGQWLVWVDERSWLPLADDLISDPAYTGFSVRNSWTKKCEEYGLPASRVYVENGIWRNAKVWAGRRLSRDQFEVGTEEAEKGIRALGIQLRHATYPRGKIIERIFGRCSDLLTGIPGWAGRNQAVDHWEEVQRRVRLVKSGKEHPSKWFLSKSGMSERLHEVLHRFSNTPMYGKYHQGLTPLECYQKNFTESKVTPVTPEIRHLIASNEIRTTVRGHGVRFKFGKREFLYTNTRLGSLIGEQVSARFNPENPRLLTVAHKSLRSPMLVELFEDGSHNASKEEMRESGRRVAEMNAYGKDLHRSLKHCFSEDFEARRFRAVAVDKQTVETSRRIREREVELKKEDSTRTRQINRVRTKARRAGYPIELVDLNDLDRAEQSLDLMLGNDRDHAVESEETVNE